MIKVKLFYVKVEHSEGKYYQYTYKGNEGNKLK